MIRPDCWYVAWNPKTPRRKPVVRLAFNGGKIKHGNETHTVQEWLALGLVIRRLILPKAALPKRAAV
jgi:hypothetical protein